MRFVLDTPFIGVVRQVEMRDNGSYLLRGRSAVGSYSAELPCVLIALLVIVVFPLIDISIFALGSATVYTAARDGAHFAARARSFSVPVPDSAGSAVAIARARARAATDSLPLLEPVTDNDVSVTIVGESLTGGPSIRQNFPLASINTSDYVYFIEVGVRGRVPPFVRLNPDLFGQVPGLTEPFPVSATFRQFVELPTGLAQ